MDHTHIHLVLSHFPIVGVFLGIGILAYGLYSKNNAIKKVALAIFILMALLTIPVFLSGEESEEVLENIPGIPEDMIEAHEELAEKAIWLMGLLGVFALIGLFALIKKLPFARIIIPITLFVSLSTAGLFAKVGQLGGVIRHSEIRKSDPDLKQTNGNRLREQHEEEDEDD